jgi:hypothetical protein
MKAHLRYMDNVSLTSCQMIDLLLHMYYLIKEYANLVTLEAYIDKYSSLVPFIADNSDGTPPTDAASPEQTSKAISLQVRFYVLTC